MRFALACVVSLCVLPFAPLVASEPRDRTVTSEKADDAATIAKVNDLGSSRAVIFSRHPPKGSATRRGSRPQLGLAVRMTS